MGVHLVIQAPFGGQVSQATTLKVLDKRTGKLLFDTDNYTGGPFYALDVDARNGKVLQFDTLLLLGFGPRTPEAATQLAAALHPELAHAR